MNETELAYNIARQLRVHRATTGRAQGDVARAVGFRQSKLSAMECGRVKDYKIQDIANLCDEYAVELAEFFVAVQPPTPGEVTV